MDKNRVDHQAAQFFQIGKYEEALHAYTECLAAYTNTAAASNAPYRKDVHISLLLNRSACFFKLKQYENVTKDCSAILELDGRNTKALNRKIKALNSLGRFNEAHEVVRIWTKIDPQNSQAKKEFDRLQVIISALQEQDGEDEEGLAETENLPGGVRIPPEGREDDSATISPNTATSTTTPASATSTQTSVTTVTSTQTSVPMVTSTQTSVPMVTSTQTSVPMVTSTQPDTSSTSDSAQATPNICTSVSAFQKQNDIIVLSPAKATTSSAAASGKSENENSSMTYPCSYCNISFVSQAELQAHCSSDLHKKKVMSDEGQEWTYRPPPRGLTAEEYALCHGFFSEGTCKFGQQCSQAHTNEELEEWRQRFEYRKQRLQKAKDCKLHGSSFAEHLTERCMNTENPDTIMTSSIEGANVHVNADLSVTMISKRSSYSWTFTITSKFILKQVILLDDTSRCHFSISAITVGPKKNQKTQKITENCQEWMHPQYDTAQISQEKVYRVKVTFKTDIYGTFRQTVVFDFNSEPLLCQQMCVDSSPVTDLEKLTHDLVLSEGGRWDLAAKTVIKFVPKPSHLCDSEEMDLVERYPPPMAGHFSVSGAVLEQALTKENYRARMHGLLYIEEMAQFSSIAKYNVRSTLQLVDRFMLMPSTASTAKFAQNGELFARMKLSADISEDVSHGRLILQNVSTVYLAPDTSKFAPDTSKSTDSTQKISKSTDSTADDSKSTDFTQPEKVYEALVEEKGKNFLFLRLSGQTVKELGLVADKDFSAEVQLHLNRLPLCEMHLAVDSLPDLDLVFPVMSPMDVNTQWNAESEWNESLDSRCNTKKKKVPTATLR